MATSPANEPERCSWCGTDPQYVAYHDEEWGVPEYDDHRLFEQLALEGSQAGLSWLTILRKRERYREVFSQFDPQRVARFTPARIDRLMQDAGIVRHRGKLEATVNNARAVIELQSEYGSFSDYIWDFVDGSPIQNRRRRLDDVPAQTDISLRMSKALKKNGFKFVGPTTCYAFMQAAGLVNDHTLDCPRHSLLSL